MASDSVWKPGTTVPAYRWPDVALSTRFWHDHRYLCSQAKIGWLYQFRKQEQQRGILRRVVRHYELNHHDVMRNENSGRRLPLLLSTMCSFAWLSTRWMMAVHVGTRADAQYANSWNAMMNGVRESCSAAVQSGALSGQPQIHAADVTLDRAACHDIARAVVVQAAKSGD